MTRRLNWLDAAQEHARMYRRVAPLLMPYDEAPNFPRCEECGHQPVDAIEMVDANRLSVVVLARHHGKEDAVRVTFETPWDDADLGRALRSTVVFPRSHHEKAAS